MSDINTNLNASTVPIRSQTQSETRREAAPSGTTAIETTTNEVANRAAQITPTAEGDTGNRPSDGEQDPLAVAAEQLQQLIPPDQLDNTSLQIELDELSGRFIFQSIDNESGEVVRQFPPEELLRLLSIVRDAEGLAVDEQA